MYWSTPVMISKKRDCEHPPVEDCYLVEGINHPLNGIYRDEVSADLGNEISLRKKHSKKSDSKYTVNISIVDAD